MNLFPVLSNSLVRKLPIHRPRQTFIKYLIYGQAAAYGGYLLMSGPLRNEYERVFTVQADSSPSSLIYYHFFHTSPVQLAFNSAVLYTLGNYHLAKYGYNHFVRFFGLACLGGSLLVGIDAFRNQNVYQAGAMAPSAALIGYHVFQNPGWFKFMFRPIPLLALTILYGAFYNDKSAIGGLAAGYLAFLFAL